MSEIAVIYKDQIRRQLKIPYIMEDEFQDQGQLDQYLEEWWSSRGSQYVHCLFSEEEKQESIKIEDSDPEGGTSTMVVIKSSEKLEGSGVSHRF